MNDDMSTEPEDERETELSSISAIFPELLLHSQEPFSASIDIPVTPSLPLQVAFPEASDGVPVAIIDTEGGKEPRRETHLLSHLPSIHLEITLPEGYPATNPPSFKLSTSPQWLSGAVLDRLVSDGLRLWEEFGHGQVVYAYIDHLQQAAESSFGILGDSEYLQVSQDLKISLLDFDIKAKRAAFEKETFDCGVCLGEENLVPLRPSND
jgi:E3 ubiquitin-protein ligase RNF14